MRHACRRLLRTPIFTLTAVLTLGAAIGANALIFSVVNGVLLKPLPFADPERLVALWHLGPGFTANDVNQSPATYFLYREEGRAFEDVGIWNNTTVSVTGRGAPEELRALTVTDGTLPILGVRPAIGRTFSREDDTPSGPDAVLISHEYWQRAFGGDPRAIEQSIVVNGRPRQVIGVLPEGFRFLQYNPAMVLPFRLNRAEVFIGDFSYQGLARLKPGVTIEQANADIARLIPSLPDRFRLPPGFTRQMFEDVRLAPLVRPLAEDVVGRVRQLLWILLGTVGIVLLVACANVANLFLVRAESRQQELAVRAALGAGRRGVIFELLSESMLLALAGGVLGIVLAAAGVRLLVALAPARLPRLEEIALDPVVVLFALGLSVVAGLLFGLVPIVRYAGPQLAAALKEGGRGSSEGRERHRARNALVVAQIALALVLLVASGLMIRTFLAMKDVAPGFTRPAEVLTFRIAVPTALVENPEAVVRLEEQIVRSIESVPGVTSVALASNVPMDGGQSADPMFVEGDSRPAGQLPPIRRYKWISQNYFRTLGNTVIAGREITWADIHGKAPVVMIAENLAREVFGSPEAAIGKRVRNSPNNRWREIIGVVGNEHDDGVAKAAPPLIYWPLLIDDYWDSQTFVRRTVAYAVRSSRPQSADLLKEVQQAVWSVNPNLPLARVQTLEEIYDASLAQTSFTLVVLGIAAAVTLLLGLVGIYGVIAYIVSQRRREVGIRIALGAKGGDVQRLFVGRGLALTGLGLAIGLVVALALMRFVSSLLFGVTAFDPVTYATVVGLLALVAVIATWLPARQATRLDPAIALRSE